TPSPPLFRSRRAGLARRDDPLAMAPRLFGTDGVRGRAGEYPLDRTTVRRLGAALVRVLPAQGSQPTLLIGRDTRESGVWLERELAHGARSAGARVVSAGVLPTPAIAYLTRPHDGTLGAVSPASHNPLEDNGIKVFSGGGQKFTEELERQVEAEIADGAWSVDDREAGEVERIDLSADYLAHLREILPDAGPLRGARLVVDCANGATHEVA